MTLVLFCLALSSCHESNITSGPLSQPNDKVTPRTSYYLINTIEVAINGQGYWEFVEDLETVEDQVELIFVDHSDFTQVDEFGFDTTSSGTQYFFAVEYGGNGARTWFVFLDPSTGAISTTYGGSQVAHGWDCENENCCDKCVAHDSLICTCHIITPGCMTQNPAPTVKCKKKGSSKA